MMQSSYSSFPIPSLESNRGILHPFAKRLHKVCACLISKSENEKLAQMQHHNRLYGNSIMKEFVPMVIRAVPHK